MRLRRFLPLAALCVALVLAAASCGRYGKPVRPDPEPQERLRHAQSAEKR